MIKEFKDELQAKALADSLGLFITKYKGVYIVSNNREEIYNSFRYNLGYYDEGDIFYDKELFKISGFLFLAIKNKNIVDASSIELPYGIKNCSQMFMDCTSLKVPPIIPKSAANCFAMFTRCISLVTSPIIPEGVKNCSYMFHECSSLETPPKIPESVEYCNHMFHDCISLKTPPHFPENCDTYEALFNTPFNRKQV